jgi:hypothetical protein
MPPRSTRLSASAGAHGVPARGRCYSRSREAHLEQASLVAVPCQECVVNVGVQTEHSYERSREVVFEG